MTEILHVISSSPKDLKPVMAAIVKHAARLAGADQALIGEREGDNIRWLAAYGCPPPSRPVRPITRDLPSGRAILDLKTTQVQDVARIRRDWHVEQAYRELGVRTIIATPLMREGRAIGVLLLRRTKVRLFSDKQIALLRTFADQAAIAIENVRLFNETKEALERQTATSEILRVISSSPTDVQPVFDAIARSAVTLCGGMFGCVFRYDGQNAHFAAHYGFSPEALENMQRRYPRAPQGLIAPTLLESAVIASPDVLSDNRSANPELHRALGVRSYLGVPMLLDGQPIGAISVWRREPGPFSDPQIAVLQTFADQAVIAIENVRLFNETKESLERQTATAEILKVISKSPSNIQPVFDAVAESAARLCDATDVIIRRIEGGVLRAVAHIGSIPLPAEVVAIPVSPRNVSGRAVIEGRTIHINDVTDDSARDGYPEAAFLAQRGTGYRTLLVVPLVRNDVAVGVIAVRREDKRPFSDQQIGLLQTFADQAVIAIQNVRLFNETKEALDQQTAISEVLRVISNSPTDVTPVLDAVAERAARICDATDALICLVEGEYYRHAAVFGDVGTLAEAIPVNRDTPSGRAILDRAPQHIDDVTADFPLAREMASRMGGWRTILSVPLLREDRALGTIVLRRKEVRPFSDKQVALLKTFADQAAIAIENVRLFNELRSTNASLREALEQQTATSDLLKVIGRSNFDLQPVFETLVENAVRLCAAERGTVFRFDGQLLRYIVGHNVSPELREFFERNPIAPGRDSNAGRAAIERRTVHNHDVLSDREYSYGGVRIDPYRTVLAVPMFRADELLGVITIYRHEVRPFSDDQVALMETFADQAAIAIENVRLFNETKEALERQTATAEILKVISRSPTDVQPVFDAIVAAAVRLCDGRLSTLLRFDGELLDLVAHHNLSGEGLAAYKRVYPMKVSRDTIAGRAVLDRAVINLADAEDANVVPPRSRAMAAAAGFRSVLVVPIMRDGEVIGIVNVSRAQPGPFSDKHVELLKTFADQAVIAIENVRLFNETKDALERQTATADILRVISGSPANVQPVFDAILASANRLCGARTAILHLYEGDEQFRPVAVHGGRPEYREWMLRSVIRIGRPFFRMEGPWKPAQIDDVQQLPQPFASEPAWRANAELEGIRTLLNVPLVKDERYIGCLTVYRREMRRFSNKEIALLQTFADQAVIAIENVRLFDETKEALDRQTAISEILEKISVAPTDMRPVLQAVVERAAHLCEAEQATVLLIDGALLRTMVNYSTDGGPLPQSSTVVKLERGYITGRAALDGEILNIEDVLPLMESEFPAARENQQKIGYRSFLAVPLMREGKAIGVIAIWRRVVRAFSDKHVALAKTFADQAAIAIENVRLFNETKEALERQTATAEILKVIAGSPSDVQPVFDAIAASAQQLILGVSANVVRVIGDEAHLAAFTTTSKSADESLRRIFPAPISGELASTRAIRTRVPVVVRDTEGHEYPTESREVARALGIRSLLAVPMVRDGLAIGAINVTRREPGAFTDHQISLLKTFADQALIAIENVRLFKELQERTQALTKSVDQLTALGEVGQAISSTLDLETVLKTIVSRAVQLSNMDGGSIYEYDEGAEEFRLQAVENMSADVVEDIRRAPTRKGDGALGRTAITLEPTQVPDTLDDTYRSARKELLIRAGYRALLAIPLLREGHLLGALLVNRQTPGPFATEVVSLLETFGAQSAIAMQNARLFREIAEKGRQLEVASHHKSQFLASMSHELRTPLNALLGFNEMILGEVYGEVPGDMKPPLEQMQASGKHLLRLINNVLDLAKIEAGRMELALSDYSVHDTVESVRSALRPLAADKGLELLAAVPEDMPLAYGDPGRITQCLMNLAGNSLKFTKVGRVEISVRLEDARLRYSVADTGVGIPADKIESLFTEFKQTDATIASEYGGTGLGLSITKKFVEMHGGRIWVESEPGRGSTFSFEIPLRAQEAKAA